MIKKKSSDENRLCMTQSSAHKSKRSNYIIETSRSQCSQRKPKIGGGLKEARRRLEDGLKAFDESLGHATNENAAAAKNHATTPIEREL